MISLIENVGVGGLRWGRYVRDVMQLLQRAIVVLLHPQGWSAIRGAAVKQIYFTGVQALPVVGLLALVLGAGIVVQTVTLVAGGGDIVGTLMEVLLIRELGPLAAAFIVIGRSGSAITVELGNLKVHSEIELLEAMGIDPVRYLVLPRMFGVTVSVVCLCIFFDLVAILGGGILAGAAVDVWWLNVLEDIGRQVTFTGVVVGLIKSIVFGVAIATLSTYHGLSAAGARTMVPVVTQRAVVHSLVLCVLLSLVITLITYSLTGWQI